MKPLIGKEYGTHLVKCIDDAKRNIDLVVYDWRVYPDRPYHPVSLFNQALIRAVRRGVRVRALVNSIVFVKYLNELGIEARTLKNARVLHSKLIMIDNKDLAIGSHNFTSNAFSVNLETSIYIEDCPVIERYRQFFENLYN